LVFSLVCYAIHLKKFDADFMEDYYVKWDNCHKIRSKWNGIIEIVIKHTAEPCVYVTSLFIANYIVLFCHYIQGDSGGKVSILGGVSEGH
jgi:hypothetical protein